MLRVVIRAQVWPTEEFEKVRRAVENLFNVEKVRREEMGGCTYLVAEGRGRRVLKRLREAFRRRQILDTARMILKRGLSGGRLTFFLHKQAAAYGVATFCIDDVQSPLGPIEVVVEGDDLQELIDWLAPSTRPKREGKRSRGRGRNV